jgi:hypothetical protein
MEKTPKFQITNENNHYFSVTMTGKPKFLDSKELGYSYDEQRAEQVAAELTRLGYQVQIVNL